MSALKIVIVGEGTCHLETLQRILAASGAHCAVSAGSAITVVDVETPKANEKLIVESFENYLPEYLPPLTKPKEHWRKGRPLK